jgi:dTDP-4-amino-4,6-dideoxygalactose transaminase
MSTTPAPVPFFDLKLQYRGLQKPIEEAVGRVLSSGQVILGAEVKEFEKEMARYCGAAFAVGCASGTDAILLALKALDIGPGDEVIVPPFTFFASAACVARLGATPVFADIEADTFNIDPHQVENKITDRTRAIMPVHMFGQCAEMEELWRISERHDIPLVEDAAQSMGSEYRGKRCGTLGGMACLSFYPTKNLGAFGDAGMVVTNDQEWAEKVACLRVHGMEPRYFHKVMGWNSRIDALQAAMLRVKLPWVERWIDARMAIARRYDGLLADHHLGGFVQRPVVRPHRRHTFNQYVIRVPNGQRDLMMQYLKSEGVGTEIYYPLPLHLQECFAYLGYRKGNFPVSEQACREVLALPMFPEISYEQQRRVVQVCAAYLRQNSRLAA